MKTLPQLKQSFIDIDDMLRKCAMMRKAAFIAGDSLLLCKYAAIECRLWEASNKLAQTLLFDYNQPLAGY